METLIASLFVLLFLIVPLFGFIAVLIINNEKYPLDTKLSKDDLELAKEYFTDNSLSFKRLKTLNEQYYFFHLDKEYYYDFTLSNKRSFDTFDPYEAFCDLCIQNEKKFREIAHKSHYNKTYLGKYDDEFQLITLDSIIYKKDVAIKYLLSKFSISETSDKAKTMAITHKEELKKLYAIENDLLEENKARPTIDPCICIRYQYTTPQGQIKRKELKEFSITDTDIDEAINHKRNAKTNSKDEIEHERSLVTAKMRYEVFKRDGFRCRICGASADDGVTLHVDHIKPVSKGGKTEMDNLRTLCSRCNLGKGASYTEDGIN